MAAAAKQEMELTFGTSTGKPLVIRVSLAETELDLSWKHITTVPSEIGNLVNLQWLDLRGNQLTALPREIGNLVNLQTLHLDNNQLTALPSEIGNLVNLKTLYLSGNPFTCNARLKALADRGEVNVAKEVLSLFPPLPAPPPVPAVVSASSASSSVAHEARGPLSEANACHAAFETAAARSDDLGKAAVRAQRELEAAADAAAEAVRKVDGERAAVADLEQRLSERRRALAAAESDSAQMEQRRASAAEQSRRALEEAQRAEEAMRKAQEALDKAGRRAAELSAALSRRDVSVLSVRDVSDVLRELGLSEHVVAAFEDNRIDGDALGTLSDENLSELGLSDSASRQRLRHAVSTVDACGQLRLAGVALERIAARAGSNGERDAVLIAGWDAERVGRWLESQKTPADVREKLAAGGVTGERLLHTDDAEIKRLGIKAMGDRNKLVRQIDAIRKSHFDALRSFFGSRSSSSSTVAAAVASPAPSVSSSSSKAATGAPVEGCDSTSVVGDGDEDEEGSGSEGVPGLFVCPISLEVMERPVVAADGFVYERTAIEQWLRTQQDRGQLTTSPMTNAPMAAEPLVQLNTLRSEIIAWKQHHHRL